MSISGDYPHPVQVNGYTCKNCTDVDYANKHIDPAHPKSGPYGVNAKADPTVQARDAFKVTFDGALKGVSGASTASAVQNTAQATAPGRTVNILA